MYFGQKSIIWDNLNWPQFTTMDITICLVFLLTFTFSFRTYFAISFTTVLQQLKNLLSQGQVFLSTLSDDYLDFYRLLWSFQWQMRCLTTEGQGTSEQETLSLLGHPDKLVRGKNKGLWVKRKAREHAELAQ